MLTQAKKLAQEIMVDSNLNSLHFYLKDNVLSYLEGNKYQHCYQLVKKICSGTTAKVNHK